MTIYIAENLKRLRKERQYSQEQLANLLNVSPQAISRWECGATTPDIGLLPAIAGCFDVSIEELLGVEQSRQQEKIDRVLSRVDELIHHGTITDDNIQEAIEITRNAVKEYPNNYILKNQLMYVLFVSGDDTTEIAYAKENVQKYSREIISLGEQILENCRDDAIRIEVKERLAFHYTDIGEIEKGRAMFESLPGIRFCREWNLECALAGDERQKHLREMIKTFRYNLFWKLEQYVEGCNVDEMHRRDMCSQINDLKTSFLENKVIKSILND